MGYTHYWRSNGTKFSDTSWASICNDVKRLIAASKVPVWREYDEPNTEPELSNDRIRFNGTGDDGCETFLLLRKPKDFEFCKTRFAPYDVLVCGALIIAHKHQPGVLSISSDGGPEDWKDALALVSQTLGDGYEIPLKTND